MRILLYASNEDSQENNWRKLLFRANTYYYKVHINWTFYSYKFKQEDAKSSVTCVEFLVIFCGIIHFWFTTRGSYGLKRLRVHRVNRSKTTTTHFITHLEITVDLWKDE